MIQQLQAAPTGDRVASTRVLSLAGTVLVHSISGEPRGALRARVAVLLASGACVCVCVGRGVGARRLRTGGILLGLTLRAPVLCSDVVADLMAKFREHKVSA